MLLRVMFAGSGGQGVLTSGNILGNAAMIDGYEVVFLPTYGAAMRGGTANCTLSISDEEIASPVVSSPDIIVAMNQPSAHAFVVRLDPGGQLMYNADLVGSFAFRGDVGLYPVFANSIARELGNERSANIVMLGALVKHTGVVTVDAVIKSLEMMLGKRKQVLDMGIKAFHEGFNRFQDSQ